MIITLDAGAGTIGDFRLRVGVYRVTREVLVRLPLMDRRSKFIAYTFGVLDRDISQELSDNVEVKQLWPRVGWSKVRLPIELLFHTPDVYLGLSQSLPWSAPKNSIGFIYDLGFLRYPQMYPDSADRLRRQTEFVAIKSKVIITISEYSKLEIIKTYGLDSEKVVVSYPGIDDVFQKEGERHIEDVPYFLYVGSLKRQKNIPFLIRCFSKFLRGQRQKYKLLLVGGDYWRDPRIDEEISKVNLEGRVKVVGYVEDEELAKYYRGALIFVSPSLVEGFCLPAVEAMASGLPVIGSTVGAFPEVVGEAGLLVDPKDEDELVRAMRRVAGSAKLRRIMSNKGLVRARKYRWDGFVKKIYEVMLKIITI